MSVVGAALPASTAGQSAHLPQNAGAGSPESAASRGVAPASGDAAPSAVMPPPRQPGETPGVEADDGRGASRPGGDDQAGAVRDQAAARARTGDPVATARRGGVAVELYLEDHIRRQAADAVEAAREAEARLAQTRAMERLIAKGERLSVAPDR